MILQEKCCVVQPNEINDVIDIIIDIFVDKIKNGAKNFTIPSLPAEITSCDNWLSHDLTINFIYNSNNNYPESYVILDNCYILNNILFDAGIVIEYNKNNNRSDIAAHIHHELTHCFMALVKHRIKLIATERKEKNYGYMNSDKFKDAYKLFTEYMKNPNFGELGKYIYHALPEEQSAYRGAFYQRVLHDTRNGNRLDIEEYKEYEIPYEGLMLLKTESFCNTVLEMLIIIFGIDILNGLFGRKKMSPDILKSILEKSYEKQVSKLKKIYNSILDYGEINESVSRGEVYIDFGYEATGLENLKKYITKINKTIKEKQYNIASKAFKRIEKSLSLHE